MFKIQINNKKKHKNNWNRIKKKNHVAGIFEKEVEVKRRMRIKIRKKQNQGL